MNSPEWMGALGVPARCIERLAAAQENQRRFKLEVAKNRTVWRVRVDGCWLRSMEQKKVDYLFCLEESSGGWKLILVELKGKDFGHALQQISQTVEFIKAQPMFRQLACKSIEAVVVLSSGNRVPDYQKERNLLRSRHNVKVIAKSKQYTMTV
jgi:hypothetical protein